MSDKPPSGRTPFYCSHCEEHVERDLLVFLSHTDLHIIEALKKEFPGWVESDGACPK